jgi:hypothetical protein
VILLLLGEGDEGKRRRCRERRGRRRELLFREFGGGGKLGGLY